MTKTYPSIFNDVIGPVMRGPSSSHCAASLRIGRLCRDLMDGTINHVLVEFDPYGSLASTHESQGSDMGLFGGILGWEAHDEQLPNYRQALLKSGVTTDIDIVDIGATHPNTYKITLESQRETRELIALSTGGGMIEVVSIDGAPVEMGGDYFEVLLYAEPVEELLSAIETVFQDESVVVRAGRESFIQVQATSLPSQTQLSTLQNRSDVKAVKVLNPVLPVTSRNDLTVPFLTVEQMLEYNRSGELSLWELAVEYERLRGNMSADEVVERMTSIVDIMSGSIDSGLRGTTYDDRILGCQSVNFKSHLEDGHLVEGDVLNTIIMFVTSMMEVKSSMGVIVAAPTAGSCGTLPGTLLGAARSLGIDREQVVKAMLAAGLIGVFISAHSTFAAEVGGCQAECGSAAGMAAAALVQMQGGTLSQSLAAASLALQNSFGMVCDPIANRVEAPCLGKNVLAASNALSCVNMALANYDHLIPFDEVVEAMNSVGNSIPSELRCTAMGGLSVTKTSKVIERRLNRKDESISDGEIVRFKSC